MNKIRLLIFTVTLTIPLIVGHADEYHIDSDAENEVKFLSEAPLENFTGTTDQIDGYVLWFGPDSLEESEIYLEVDLGSLDTGIGLRNRHMRENYLETDEYPYAVYKAKCVEGEIKPGGKLIALTTDGTIRIHGTERPLQIHGLVGETADGFEAEAKFEIKLSDFNIKIPKLMFMKINEVIKLEVNIHLEKIQSN
jgi:polyisoprenoid-binding protein YceI